MKNKKVKKVRLRVIQQNKITGHPSYPFSQTNNSVKSVGFTHNSDEKHGKKIKLKHNINPNDKGNCYVKVTIEKQKSKDYVEKAKFKNHKIHPEDQPTINSIIRKNKKR